MAADCTEECIVFDVLRNLKIGGVFKMKDSDFFSKKVFFKFFFYENRFPK